MKLGFDIDDTLNYQYEFLIDRGLKFLYENNLMDAYEEADFRGAHPFTWKGDWHIKFWTQHREELVSHLPPKTFAPEILRKLHDEGHEIHLITARTEIDPLYPDYMQGEISQYTKKWLKKFDIPYDELHFATADKGACCRENGIDIMVEDDCPNLRKLMGNTHIIVYNMPYNNLPEFDGLDRAHGWYAVYWLIHKFIDGSKK